MATDALAEIGPSEIIDMLIVHSNSLDVHRNLAVEEYLLDHAEGTGPVLFLWRSDCAVVIGKNQNPWRECRLDLMRSEDVPLARRVSGGGAVYHDAGNLNYCVIVDRTEYRELKAYELVAEALKGFGIRAERSGRSSLSIDGLKFSGNAFCFRKGRAMHHGTLLLETDLERLGRYLGSMGGSFETHAIRSVPAPVANLHVGVADISSALEQAFDRLYGDGEIMHCPDSDFDGGGLSPLVERQRSREWRFGATPRFAVRHRDWNLDVVKGEVVRVEGPGSEMLEGSLFEESAFVVLLG